MDNGKLYPLYCDFVTAFTALYPEEDIDDITEYFLCICGTDQGKDDINLYIVVYETMKERG